MSAASLFRFLAFTALLLGAADTVGDVMEVMEVMEVADQRPVEGSLWRRPVEACLASVPVEGSLASVPVEADGPVEAEGVGGGRGGRWNIRH